MKWLILCAVAAVLGLMGVSADCTASVIDRSQFGPNAIELDFDEPPVGTVIGDMYSDLGVTFDNAYVRDGVFYIHILWVSEPNTITGSNRNAPVSIYFPTGAIRVGINIDSDGYDASVRQPKMRIFDSHGGLLDDIDFEQGPDFIGFESLDAPIGHIELGATTPNTPNAPLWLGDSFDNLIFEINTVSAVPEPSAVIIWAILGTLGIIAGRWRRK